MDLSSLIGTLLGLLIVFIGALLEGLHLGEVIVLSSGIIILAGTYAAVLLAFPLEDVQRACRSLSLVYRSPDLDVRPSITEIVRIAEVARKEGVLAIEGQRQSIQDPLFKRSLQYVVDGFDSATVREIVDAEISLTLDEDMAAARVWEGAGKAAAALGLLAALLSFMRSTHVSSALVALVYGLAWASLILFPWAAKLKRRAAQKIVHKQVVKLGVLGILDGINPQFLKEKLEVFAEGPEA